MVGRLPVVVLAAALLSFITLNVAAQTRPTRLQGEIVGLEGAILRVKTASGEVTPIALTETLRVVKRVPIDLDHLKPGLFLGATAMPQPDGTLLASEVHVFPEAARGRGDSPPARG